MCICIFVLATTSQTFEYLYIRLQTTNEQQALGVSASCGIGPNKLLARLASAAAAAKPNGQGLLPPDPAAIDVVRLFCGYIFLLLYRVDRSIDGLTHIHTPLSIRCWPPSPLPASRACSNSAGTGSPPWWRPSDGPKGATVVVMVGVM